MTTKGPNHIRLTGSGFYDAKLTFDGEPFPYDIYSVQYALNSGEGPTVTVEFRPQNLTIEHTPPAPDSDHGWEDRLAEACDAAEAGTHVRLTGRHGNAQIHIAVVPDSDAGAEETA